MKRIVQILGLAMVLMAFTGCRGLVSEMQKSDIRAATSTNVVAGQELRLEADLNRHTNSLNKGFDLAGTIRVVATSGSFPKDASIHHFSLKPSWKGWPFYYVINFDDYGGTWAWTGTYGNKDPKFSATSKTENGQFVIDFLWKDQGRASGTKPEHFAAYDVAVTITGPDKKDHLLSSLSVPAK